MGITTTLRYPTPNDRFITCKICGWVYYADMAKCPCGTPNPEIQCDMDTPTNKQVSTPPMENSKIPANDAVGLHDRIDQLIHLLYKLCLEESLTNSQTGKKLENAASTQLTVSREQFEKIHEALMEEMFITVFHSNMDLIKTTCAYVELLNRRLYGPRENQSKE